MSFNLDLTPMFNALWQFLSTPDFVEAVALAMLIITLVVGGVKVIHRSR